MKKKLKINDSDLETELRDLKYDLENFQKDKERVRAIIGKIGGVPHFHTKIINTLFTVVLFTSVVISFYGGERLRPLMIEFAVIALSVKIIYMVHCQTKVNHFKLWMMSSLEWRINEMMRLMREIHRKLPDEVPVEIEKDLSEEQLVD